MDIGIRVWWRLLGALILGLVAVEATAQSGRVVAYTIVNAREIPRSLTGGTGDAETGRRLYFDRERAGCSGCHGSPGGPGAEQNAGAQAAPALDGVAQRMSEGAMRLWLVAPQVARPGTLMPSYYAAAQREDPNDPRFGEPRLSAYEIEHLIAYLARQATAQ